MLLKSTTKKCTISKSCENADNGRYLYWYSFSLWQFQQQLIVVKINHKEMHNKGLFIDYPAVTYATFQHQGCLFWITCNRPKLLRKAGRLQLIQNSTPSVALMRQCCIQIDCLWRGNLMFIYFDLFRISWFSKFLRYFIFVSSWIIKPKHYDLKKYYTS